MSRETKPYREGKANRMNDKINIALQDITAIKETLDDAKVHYRGMYLMCFLLAAFNGVKYVWLLLEMSFHAPCYAGKLCDELYLAAFAGGEFSLDLSQ